MAYVTPFTIAAAQIPSSQSNFHAVLLPTDNRFKHTSFGGHVASLLGYDIRLYNDSALTSPITHELVSYSPSSGMFEIWGSITAVVGKVVYAAYGYPAIVTDGSGNPFASTWKRVFHFGDGTTLSNKDSTGNNNGTFANSPTAAAGKIGGAVSFVAASAQYMDCGNHDSIAAYVSMWVNRTSIPGDYIGLFSKRNVDSSAYFQMLDRGLGAMAYFLNTTGGDVSQNPGTGSMVSGWYHNEMMFDSANGLRAYLDGALVVTPHGSGNDIAIVSGKPAPIRISGDQGFAGREFDGLVDEVQYADTVPSDDFRAGLRNNQLAPNTFWTMGAEGPAPVSSSPICSNIQVGRGGMYPIGPVIGM